VGILGKKEVRMVELQQFGSLGGGGGFKCHVLNIGGQSTNGWIVRGVNCIFPFCFVLFFVSAGVVLARLVG
jgi:hypothetical protein